MKIENILSALSTNSKIIAMEKNNQDEMNFLLVLGTELNSENKFCESASNESSDEINILYDYEETDIETNIELDKKLIEFMASLFNNIKSSEQISINEDKSILNLSETIEGKEIEINNEIFHLKTIDKLMKIELDKDEVQLINEKIYQLDNNKGNYENKYLSTNNEKDNSEFQNIKILDLDIKEEFSRELDLIKNLRTISLNSKNSEVEKRDIKSVKINSNINNLEGVNTLNKILEDSDFDINKDLKVSKLERYYNHEILNNNLDLGIVNNITFSDGKYNLTFNDNYTQVIRSEYIKEDFIQMIKYIKSNNIEELTVKINPEDLGEINIKILKVDNEEKLLITLSKEESFSLLKENINEIKAHLSNLQINIKEISFEIKKGNESDFLNNLNQDFNKNNTKEERKNKRQITQENKRNNDSKDDVLNIDLII